MFAGFDAQQFVEGTLARRRVVRERYSLVSPAESFNVDGALRQLLAIVIGDCNEAAGVDALSKLPWTSGALMASLLGPGFEARRCLENQGRFTNSAGGMRSSETCHSLISRQAMQEQLVRKTRWLRILDQRFSKTPATHFQRVSLHIARCAYQHMF